MTRRKVDKEGEALVAMAAILKTLPKDARFRSLAFLAATTIRDPSGRDDISDALYAKAAKAREVRAARKRSGPRAGHDTEKGGTQ